MRTAWPFEPLWQSLTNGVVISHGKGLAPPTAKQCDRFDVVLGDCRLSILPSGGILLDGTRIYSGPSGKVLWARRMSMDYATRDTNVECTPECQYYMAGISSESGDDFVKIKPDLTLEYPCRS